MLETETATTTADITTGGLPEGIAISADGGRVFVTDYNADRVLEIDPDRGEAVAEIHVGANPQGLAVL